MSDQKRYEKYLDTSFDRELDRLAEIAGVSRETLDLWLTSSIIESNGKDARHHYNLVPSRSIPISGDQVDRILIALEGPFRETDEKELDKEREKRRNALLARTKEHGTAAEKLRTKAKDSFHPTAGFCCGWNVTTAEKENLLGHHARRNGDKHHEYRTRLDTFGYELGCTHRSKHLTLEQILRGPGRKQRAYLHPDCDTRLDDLAREAGVSRQDIDNWLSAKLMEEEGPRATEFYHWRHSHECLTNDQRDRVLRNCDLKTLLAETRRHGQSAEAAREYAEDVWHPDHGDSTSRRRQAEREGFFGHHKVRNGEGWHERRTALENAAAGKGE